MTTKNIQIKSAGFLENLKNAMFSNDLLHVRGESTAQYWIRISSVQQEDGSSNGYNIQGALMLSESEESFKKNQKIKGYLKYSDRSKPGTGLITIEE